MPQTVLLTGTSSGIGEAAALAFLDRGWNVVATARTPQVPTLPAEGPTLLWTRLDVTETASIEAAFEAGEQRFGQVDVVVNNAGVGLGGALEGMSLDDLRNQLEVNVVGVAAICQAAIRRMRPRQAGLIINVSSLVGRVGFPFLSPYCASKFAIEGLSESLRFELRPFGIGVKLIEPGGVRTNFSHLWRDHPAYEPRSGRVHAMMEDGGRKAALPAVAARTIVRAAADRSDRLRYAATDAGRMLLLRDYCRIACGARSSATLSRRRGVIPFTPRARWFHRSTNPGNIDHEGHRAQSTRRTRATRSRRNTRAASRDR